MTTPHTRLRFGIMVRSARINAWQAEVIAQLLAVPGVEPVLVIVDDRPPASSTASSRLGRLTRSSSRLWNLYNNGWVARRSTALRPADLPSAFADVPRLAVRVDQRGHSEHFTDEDVATIRASELDFLVRFGFGIIRGEILDVAKHGIWSFHHGDDTVSRGGPPAFWELVRGDEVTGAILQQLTDRLDAGHVLARGWFPTARHSYVRNTDRVHFGGVLWPAQMARRLLDGGDLEHAATSTSTAPPTTRPPDRVMFKFLLTQTVRFARHQWTSLVRSDDWHIGVVDAPVAAWLDDDFEPTVRWIESASSDDSYAADPFVVDLGGRTTVLYERYDRRQQVGQIWQADIADTSASRAARFPIEQHASYPFVFEHAGRTLCLPQVSRPGVPLFESVDGGWQHVRDLIPGIQVLDPTLLHREERWWLFGCLPGRESTTQLHIWHASELDGPWTPHRHNPVKTDTRSARPAGGFFTSDDGRLIRLAQNCAEGYGRSIAMCEVRRLDESQFHEVVLADVSPARSWPYHAAMHTLTGRGELSVIDAASLRFDRHRMGAELSARWRRLGRSHQQEAPEQRRVDTVGRLRVLAVIDALGEGGSERSLAELLPLLRERQIDTTLVLLKSRGSEGVENWVRSLGFEIHLLPAGAIPRSRALRRLIEQLDPDVIHSTLFAADLTTRIASLGRSTPLLTSLVSTTYSDEHLAAAAAARWKLRIVQMVDFVSGRWGQQHFHAVSDSVRVNARHTLRIPDRKITVVPRGRRVPTVNRSAARSDIRAELGLDADAQIFIGVGRHEPAKDIPTLIAASALALSTRPDAVLVLAGRAGSATPAVEAALDQIDPAVRNRVKVLGHRADVSELLGAADFFVSTSLYEGLPGAIIEAMAASLAVVASDIAPTREVVTAGTSAVVCPPGDIDAFARAIGSMLDDAGMRQRLGSAGRIAFEERFTSDRAADAMARLYHRLAGADRYGANP